MAFLVCSFKLRTTIIAMRNLYVFFIVFLLNSFSVRAQVSGCTDPAAQNYNPAATQNDGSCNYSQVSVNAEYVVNLPDAVAETSGLIYWDGQLYTHNDSNDLTVYDLDAGQGTITSQYNLEGYTNTDWEEITQDDEFVYIGDFGNNLNGNRADHRILKINKQSLLLGAPETSLINFSYEDQSDFNPTGGNNTDFDCEAFIASQDSIYLFTKQWNSKKTSLYKLPKTAGTHIAQYKDTFNVNGLITGGTYLEDKRLVVLCGYSTILQPFVYLLYDFNNHEFFSGNKRKIKISAPFHQVEGITTPDGLHYYVSNENFTQAPFINVPQKLGYYDLSEYLGGYFQQLADESTEEGEGAVLLFPNPTDGTLHIVLKDNITKTTYRIVDMAGQQVAYGILTRKDSTINIGELQGGMYLFKIDLYPGQAFRLVKM